MKLGLTDVLHRLDIGYSCAMDTPQVAAVFDQVIRFLRQHLG